MQNSNDNPTQSNTSNWTDLRYDLIRWTKQNWQQIGCTESETNEWLDIGFTLDDYNVVQKWKSHNLTPSQIKEWITIGLSKGENREHYFVFWLRSQGFTPNTVINVSQLRTQFNSEFNNLAQTNSQQWLELYYPNKSINKLDISNNKLIDLLNFSSYQELKELNCSNNQLTNLDLSNCQQLRKIECYHNQFPNFNFLSTLPNPKRITNLQLNNNPINPTTLNFLTPFVGLKWLFLGDSENITNFYGPLSPLSNCQHLKTLDIRKTYLNSDIELLPPNLETIYAHNMPEFQRKLKGFEDEYGYGYENGKYNYQSWRTNQLPLIKTIESLQKQNSLFQQKEKEILYLELRVQELTNLIKTQKQKIINTFLRLFPEKDLLQELITVHLEFTRFKETEKDFVGYDDKYEEYEDKERDIRKQLRNKLDKDNKVMDTIRSILTDCEHLIRDELELEQKLKDKNILIEDQKQTFKITNDGEKKTKIEQHEIIHKQQVAQYNRERQKSLTIANLKGQVKALKQITPNIIYNIDQISQGMVGIHNAQLRDFTPRTTTQSETQLSEEEQVEIQPQTEQPPKYSY